MEFSKIAEQLDQILNQERIQPSIRYEPTVTEPGILSGLANSSRAYYLVQERRLESRDIHENPSEFHLTGTNYDLLRALLAHVPENFRDGFFALLRARVLGSSSFSRLRLTSFPSWNGYVSDLPLIVEFCLRNGDKQNIVRALHEAPPSPGMILALMEIEELLILNFTVFSDSELEHLSSTVASVRQKAISQAARAKAHALRGSGKQFANSVYAEIDKRCKSIFTKCEKTRYLYTKHSLLQNANLEINQDKTAVEAYLNTLGFSTTLRESLNYAEKMYSDSKNLFDLKSSIGHLRSFLEKLHAEGSAMIHKRLGGNLPSTWSLTLAFLRNCGSLSQAEEKFVAGLYALLSDQAVHPLVAEREYARLMRNVVIEYGLLFLKRVEKTNTQPAQAAP